MAEGWQWQSAVGTRQSAIGGLEGAPDGEASPLQRRRIVDGSADCGLPTGDRASAMSQRLDSPSTPPTLRPERGAREPWQQHGWLVLRAQAGDRDAFDSLLRTLQQPLYRYLVGLVGSRSLAEDLLQDTFLLVYRKLRWLREPELFRPWAFRIASREAFRRLRRDRRYAGAELDESQLAEVPDVAATPEDRELARRLPDLVAGISPGSRAVIALHYLEEMPLAEVSAVLGIALGTVKSRLAYGLTQLRRALHTDDPTTKETS